MRLSFHCPHCRQSATFAPSMMGQTVACPACAQPFRLDAAAMSGGAIVAPPVAASSAKGGSAMAAATAAPPAAPTTKSTQVARMPMPPGMPAGDPMRPVAAPPVHAKQTTAPPVALAPSPAKSNSVQQPATTNGSAQPTSALASTTRTTARFITTTAAESVIKPAADGRLPDLQLADSPDRKALAARERKPNTWLLPLALVVSCTMSLLMLLVDFDSGPTATSAVQEAREQLPKYFQPLRGPLLPYQQYLRESQRAHARGDYAAERNEYRKVLALLRDESRGKFAPLTGTTSGDAELERLIATLLAAPARND